MQLNKKDMFIKEKLQQDKKISDKANKIFDNIKGEFKMENNEKKVIKISFNKFLAIAASLVIVGFVGVSIYANSIGKPNIISGIQALIKNEPEENTDEIAKELFEKAMLAIRDPYKYYETTDADTQEIQGKVYRKTSSTYDEIESRYNEIFADEALKNVLDFNFYNEEGIMYALEKAGGTPWQIVEIKVEKTNEEKDELTYNAIYKLSYTDDTAGKELKEQKCQFKMKKVDEQYKISATNFLNIDGIEKNQNNIANSNLDNETAKELFEKGANEIRKLWYSDLGKSEYEVDGNLIKKEINETTYIKTNEKYETVEQKYGEIFTDKALKNVLSMRFANVDGVLYISDGGASGWDITNVEVQKINEQNGEITYRASYNNVNVDGSISKENYTCEFKIKEINGEYKISETDYCNSDRVKENQNSTINNLERDNIELTKYVYSEIGVNFYYPDEWAGLDNNHGSGAVGVWLAPESNEKHVENVYFWISEMPDDNNLLPTECVNKYGDFANEIGQGDMSVNGNRGYYIKNREYKTENGTSYEYESTTVYVKGNSTMYEIEFSGDKKLYDQYYKTFEKMLETVKFK